MTERNEVIIEVDLDVADVSMDEVADRVVAVLAEGRFRIVDFATAPDGRNVVRAVGHRGGHDAV